MTPGFSPLAFLHTDEAGALSQHYASKDAPHPDPTYNIEPHLLHHAENFYDMSRFLDSDYCRFLDVKVILSTRRPTLDKAMPVIWDDKIGKWAQH